MASQLSIQNFYRREVAEAPSSDANRLDSSSSPLPGDAFTTEEVDAVMSPDGLPPWKPSQAYQEVDVAAIRPGPGCIVVTGRIVNVLKRPHSSQPGKPSSYLNLFVKDDTGVVSVWIPRRPWTGRNTHCTVGQGVASTCCLSCLDRPACLGLHESCLCYRHHVSIQERGLLLH